MDEQKEFEEAVDAVGDAFTYLMAIVFARSATLHGAIKKVESVLTALHGTFTEVAIESAMKKKGE